MDKMLMAVFDTAPQAFKGLIALKELHRAGDITLYATAVIAKDPSGMISIKQASERQLAGAPLGLLSGILLSTWGGPLGLAIGGSIGGLAGLIFDLAKAGISADFLEDVSQALAPGKAVLLAEIDETLVAPVDMKLVNLGGHVYRRQRSEFAEDQLLHEFATINVELKQLQEELAQSSAEARFVVQEQLEAAKRRLATLLSRADARQEQAKIEGEVKIHTLQEQMDETSEEKKGKTEQRIAEVKAAYEVRQAKLKKALGSFRKDLPH